MDFRNIHTHHMDIDSHKFTIDPHKLEFDPHQKEVGLRDFAMDLAAGDELVRKRPPMLANQALARLDRRFSRPGCRRARNPRSFAPGTRSWRLDH